MTRRAALFNSLKGFTCLKGLCKTNRIELI